MAWKPTPTLNSLPGFAALTAGEQQAVRAVLEQYGQFAPTGPVSFGFAYAGALLEASQAVVLGRADQALLGTALFKLGLKKDPNRYKAPVDFNPFLAVLEKADKAMQERIAA